MPWLETNPMDERVRFIVELEEGLYSFAELSERGVSGSAGITGGGVTEDEGRNDVGTVRSCQPSSRSET